MKKKVLFILPILLLSSCSSNNEAETDDSKKTEILENAFKDADSNLLGQTERLNKYQLSEDNLKAISGEKLRLRMSYSSESTFDKEYDSVSVTLPLKIGNDKKWVIKQKMPNYTWFMSYSYTSELLSSYLDQYVKNVEFSDFNAKDEFEILDLCSKDSIYSITDKGRLLKIEDDKKYVSSSEINMLYVFLELESQDLISSKERTLTMLLASPLNETKRIFELDDKKIEVNDITSLMKQENGKVVDSYYTSVSLKINETIGENYIKVYIENNENNFMRLYENGTIVKTGDKMEFFTGMNYINLSGLTFTSTIHTSFDMDKVNALFN